MIAATVTAGAARADNPAACAASKAGGFASSCDGDPASTGRSRKTRARLPSRRSLPPPLPSASTATIARDRVSAVNDPAPAAESLRSLRAKSRFARGRGSPAADPAAGPPTDPASDPATTAPTAGPAAAPAASLAANPAANPVADRAAHWAGPTGGLKPTTSPSGPPALLAARSVRDGGRPAARREGGESAPGARSGDTAAPPAKRRDGEAPRGRPKAARNGGVREIAMLVPAASAGSHPALLFRVSRILWLGLRCPATGGPRTTRVRRRRGLAWGAPQRRPRRQGWPPLCVGPGRRARRLRRRWTGGRRQLLRVA